MIQHQNTETEKLQEFEDKISAIQRDELKNGKRGLTMFCPWCRQINDGDAADCCQRFAEAKEKRANRQLREFFAAYERLENGESQSITCPYCGDANWIPSANPTSSTGERHPSEWKRPMKSPFCCDLFEMAAIAVVNKKMMDDQVEHYHRIQDGMAKAGNN